MTVEAKRLRIGAAAAALAALLGGCAQPSVVEKPGWIRDLDRRSAEALAATAYAPAAPAPTVALSPKLAPSLAFDVATDATAQVFAERLLAVAERCWVQGDPTYAAAPRAGGALRLVHTPDGEGAEPVEALLIEASAVEGGLRVAAVGPLATEPYRAVIERGLRQAADDLSACL